ncbi:hypothetical protein EUX98_g7096 [Antrodiella citrinella]|uniref:Uncharacterized protein n=1 Tax=Antrodiella citrinella TaxID=2447956 RepID=A0A4S4MPW4_9APHY|nr:hypothetical protein EUX98_g7096 [Antrodiella citrinella]
MATIQPPSSVPILTQSGPALPFSEEESIPTTPTQLTKAMMMSLPERTVRHHAALHHVPTDLSKEEMVDQLYGTRDRDTIVDRSLRRRRSLRVPVIEKKFVEERNIYSIFSSALDMQVQNRNFRPNKRFIIQEARDEEMRAEKKAAEDRALHESGDISARANTHGMQTDNAATVVGALVSNTLTFASPSPSTLHSILPPSVGLSVSSQPHTRSGTSSNVASPPTPNNSSFSSATPSTATHPASALNASLPPKVMSHMKTFQPFQRRERSPCPVPMPRLHRKRFLPIFFGNPASPSSNAPSQMGHTSTAVDAMTSGMPFVGFSHVQPASPASSFPNVPGIFRPLISWFTSIPFLPQATGSSSRSQPTTPAPSAFPPTRQLEDMEFSSGLMDDPTALPWVFTPSRPTHFPGLVMPIPDAPASPEPRRRGFSRRIITPLGLGGSGPLGAPYSKGATLRNKEQGDREMANEQNDGSDGVSGNAVGGDDDEDEAMEVEETLNENDNVDAAEYPDPIFPDPAIVSPLTQVTQVAPLVDPTPAELASNPLWHKLMAICAEAERRELVVLFDHVLNILRDIFGNAETPTQAVDVHWELICVLADDVKRAGGLEGTEVFWNFVEEFKNGGVKTRTFEGQDIAYGESRKRKYRDEASRDRTSSTSSSDGPSDGAAIGANKRSRMSTADNSSSSIARSSPTNERSSAPPPSVFRPPSPSAQRRTITERRTHTGTTERPFERARRQFDQNRVRRRAAPLVRTYAMTAAE